MHIVHIVHIVHAANLEPAGKIQLRCGQGSGGQCGQPSTSHEDVAVNYEEVLPVAVLYNFKH